MHDDRHAMSVGGAEHALECLDVLRIEQVDVRVAKVHLEAGAQLGIFGAPIDFFTGVIAEWIDAAEANEPLWVSSDFSAGPVVLCLDVLVLVHWRAVGIAELVSRGTAPQRARCRPHRVTAQDPAAAIGWRLGVWRYLGAEEMLVIVGNRSDVVLQRAGRGGAEARKEDRSAAAATALISMARCGDYDNGGVASRTRIWGS